MRPHRKRYLIESWPVLIPCAPVIWIPSASAHRAIPSWQRALVALSPLPALAWTVMALPRRLPRNDEFEQRIELIATPIAATSTGLSSFVWALESGNLAPRDALFLVLPALALMYGFVKLCARWYHQ